MFDHPPSWPAYQHDETKVCRACKGNGYVPKYPPNQLHPIRTCPGCCGSGCVTTFLERNAA